MVQSVERLNVPLFVFASQFHWFMQDVMEGISVGVDEMTFASTFVFGGQENFAIDLDCSCITFQVLYWIYIYSSAHAGEWRFCA